MSADIRQQNTDSSDSVIVTRMPDLTALSLSELKSIVVQGENQVLTEAVKGVLTASQDQAVVVAGFQSTIHEKRPAKIEA